MDDHHVVYRAVGLPDVSPVHQPAGFDFEIWSPSLTRILPPGVPRKPYAAWWLFHRTHVFRNCDYAVVLGWHRRQLVHRLGVFPGYFRFPFMGPKDLQIGDVWTAPAHRGRGLAVCGLRFAMTRHLESARPRLLVRLARHQHRLDPHGGTCRVCSLRARGADPSAGISRIGCFRTRVRSVGRCPYVQATDGGNRTPTDPRATERRSRRPLS